MAEPTIAELEQRLAAAAEPDDVRARVDALNALSWAIRFRELTRAHALAAEARELAREAGYALGQARAARTLAMTIGDADSLASMFAHAEEARQLFDEAGDPAGRAASRDFLASLHEHIGDLAGGLELALDALAIARELGDPVRQGYALSSVGGILTASGEYDEAVARLEEALALFEGVGNLPGQGTICSRLCRVLKRAGRDDEALGYAEQCRAIAAELDDSSLNFTAYTVMAEVEEERGEWAEAERFYRAALSSLEGGLGRDVMGTEAQVALGRLLLRCGELERAEVELHDALKRVADNPASERIEAAARRALSELGEARGDHREALEQLRRAGVLVERIAGRDARHKLAQVEARAAVEAAKKDAEIHKLRYVELHGMQARLVQAEKMALLGKLAAGTAHELNTPLGVLRSNAGLVARAGARLAALVPEGERAGAERLVAALQSCQQTSDAAVVRIAAIAEAFLRFSGVDRAERRPVDLCEGLQSALTLLRPTLPAGVTVETRLDPVPPVEGWPRQLHHGFLTVLQNAAQAIDGAGVVTVQTEAGEGEVRVRIRDTGRGMDPEQLARLFEVSLEDSEGRTRMRLGLSATRATVEQHGGTIEVQSAPGQGTTVTFHLPLRR